MKLRMGVILAIAGILSGPLAQEVCAQAAQPGSASAARPAVRYSAEQLDQMLAPIALYPDTLLTQILMASTYPLEVVEADRWVQEPRNAALSGADLDTALMTQPWDPSVKSLVPFPQILRMMDSNLNWTEQLGDAFLADERAVMDAVQRLRKQAADAGNLRSTAYQTVQTQGSVIVIESPTPDVVYVPVYDPFVVYGAWPYPAYPPYYFPGYFSAVVSVGFGFGWFSFPIVPPLWGWGYWDWRHNDVYINRARYNQMNFRGRRLDHDVWRHDPYHRHGVPYRDERTRERFEGHDRMMDARRFRGYPPPPSSAAGVVQSLPQVVHPLPPVVQPLPQVVKPLPQVVKPLPQVVQPLPPVVQPLPGPDQHEPRPGQREPGVVQPGPAQRQPERDRSAPGSRQPPAAIQPRPGFEGGQRAPEGYGQPRFRGPAPPAFESFGRGAEVRSESARGFSSRQSVPMGQPAPMQRSPGAAMPRGGGGGGGHFPGGGGGGGGRRQPGGDR